MKKVCSKIKKNQINLFKNKEIYFKHLINKNSKIRENKEVNYQMLYYLKKIKVQNLMQIIFQKMI